MTSATTESRSESLLSSEDLYSWLNAWPNVSSQLKLVVVGLRRRQLSGAHPCAKASIEILRSLLGTCKFNSTYHMIVAVKAVGRELANAAPSELTLGNIIRRVVFLIREEYTQKLRISSKKDIITNNSLRGTGDALSSQEEMVYFSRSFPDMRQSLMAAVIELNEEIDNVFAPICEQAQEHIHNDECVLVYGHSPTLELFLKAAARKRRFQVIIAEASPSLEGHKLALSLSKIVGGNISVTLIPDSGIYAIMSRVNKVLFSPHAVVADGGAICRSGHLMVATAAKEFSVPVIGVTGAFLLTPLFAHNQNAALGQLLSPAISIAYNADVDFQNVEVIVPAFDFLPPDLMELYVTNNGSHQPSYIYRLLAEYYHPNDYIL